MGKISDILKNTVRAKNYFNKTSICSNTVVKVEKMCLIPAESKKLIKDINISNDYDLNGIGHLGITLEYIDDDGRIVDKTIGILTSKKNTGTIKIGEQILRNNIKPQHAHFRPFDNLIDVLNNDTMVYIKYTCIPGIFTQISPKFIQNRNLEDIMYDIYIKIKYMKENMITSFVETTVPNQLIHGPEIVKLETDQTLMVPLAQKEIRASNIFKNNLSERNFQFSQIVKFVEGLIDREIPSEEVPKIIEKHSIAIKESFNEIEVFYNEEIEPHFEEILEEKKLSNTDQLDFLTKNLPYNLPKHTLSKTDEISQEFWLSVDSIQHMRHDNSLESKTIITDPIKIDIDTEHN